MLQAKNTIFEMKSDFDSNTYVTEGLSGVGTY